MERPEASKRAPWGAARTSWSMCTLENASALAFFVKGALRILTLFGRRDRGARLRRWILVGNPAGSIVDPEGERGGTIVSTLDGHRPGRRKRCKSPRHARSPRATSRREAAHAALCEQARAEGRPVPALRDMPHSNRLKAAIRVLGKRHTKVVRCREHAQKKKAAELADRLSRLAVEEHPLGFMLRNRAQAKSASDRSIGGFKRHLASALGRERYVAVPNRRAGIGGNSQTCVCGQPVPKRLKERVHACPACGLTAPRDMVSANIVRLIAFGTLHEALLALLPAGAHPVHAVRGEPAAPRRKASRGGRRKSPSAGGQPVVRRGGTEAAASEGPARESAPGGAPLRPGLASEAPAKRRSPTLAASSACPCMERARVGNLPRQARPGGIAKGASPGRCRPEPTLRASALGRSEASPGGGTSVWAEAVGPPPTGQPAPRARGKPTPFRG